MKMRSLTALLGVAAALSVSACASTASGVSSSRTGFLTYDDCFFSNSVTDWRPLDNMNLVVFTGARRPYHVQLSMRSMSLRYEDTIAFTDRDGRICPFGGDSIVVNGAMPDRIPIASIRRLTETQLEDLYRSYNIIGPEIIEAPADSEE
jgi:hypothetical protein